MKQTAHIILGSLLRSLWCIPFYFIAGSVFGIDAMCRIDLVGQTLTTCNPISLGFLGILVVGVIYDLTT